MAYIPAEQRRQDLVEAAVRVVAEQGVRGATTRRIAAEADAPLATLHYCFHTKENLFFAVFQHINEQVSGGEPREQRALGLRRAATDLMTATVQWSVDHETYALAQFDLYLWAIREERRDGSLAVDVYDLFIDRFCQVLRASLTAEDDPALVRPLARVMASLIDGMTMQWNGHRDQHRLREDLALANAMLDSFLAMGAARV
ncbi:MAG: putative TetR family transcriptional regulator [Aeromicrobium sp.]|jgi:AcrR family transcriptional regulator|nr:putative TetR family transcriptional regulator [Aeromicrobium sp.]